MKVWHIAEMKEVLKLNTRGHIKKVKKLILDEDWFLQVIHQGGVSLFNLRNNRSRLLFPSYNQYVTLLKNRRNNLLLTFDNLRFMQIDSKSHFVRGTTQVAENHYPEAYLQDSFVLCKMYLLVDVIDKEMMNIGFLDEDEEDDEPGREAFANEDLKSTNHTIYKVLNLRRLNERGQPNSVILLQIGERAASTDVFEVGPDAQSQPLSKGKTMYDFFVLLQSFQLEKIRFVVDAGGEGSVEIMRKESLLSTPQSILSLIPHPGSRAPDAPEIAGKGNVLKSTQFSLENISDDHADDTKLLKDSEKTSMMETPRNNYKTGQGQSGPSNEARSAPQKYTIDHALYLHNQAHIVMAVRVELESETFSYICLFDLESQKGYSQSMDLQKSKKLTDRDKFSIKAMGGNWLYAFGRIGIFSFQVGGGQGLVAGDRREFDDRRLQRVEYSAKNQMFFVMSDFKIKLLNRDLSLELHSLSSKQEYVEIALNEANQHLLIYSKQE